MRIHIRHEIELVFESPVRALNAALRMTPRSHESQQVVRWRAETDGDSRIRAADDAFGNIVHALSMTGPVASLRILAEGVVETFDAAGIVRAAVERFPPELYLRDTALTQPRAEHRALVADLDAGNSIEALHTLLLRISGEDVRAAAAQSQTQQVSQAPAPAAAAAGEIAGAATDLAQALAHDFIVCARLIGAPARFISGYHIDPKAAAGGAHCWAEAYVDGVGWIGFDPAHAICPHESHARMASGLDARDAACVRAAPAPASAAAQVIVTRADQRHA